MKDTTKCILFVIIFSAVVGAGIALPLVSLQNQREADYHAAKAAQICPDQVCPASIRPAPVSNHGAMGASDNRGPREIIYDALHVGDPELMIKKMDGRAWIEKQTGDFDSAD